jgi:hypothetical protein
MKNLTRRDLCKALPTLGLFSAAGPSAFAQLITGKSMVQPGADKIKSKLDISSSGKKLVDVFHWAREQAMAYAFDNGDPVGPWYEAVEPGREAFCIRDTCHQAVGAQALGLERFTLNMLRRFAEGVSDSKDWCSYWEIDRFNHPAPVDYENDASFWYNLPANFDLVDCCFRMYVWSGEQAYIDDPVFLNFYRRTVYDYVQRWDLDFDHIMTRPRLLNVRGVLDPEAKFPKNRGIPGYNEQDHTFVLGFDVVQTERAAFLGYAHLQQARMNAREANLFLKKAAQFTKLIEAAWWNKTDNCFYQRVNAGHKLEGCGGRRLMGQTPRLQWRTDVVSSASDFVTAADANTEMARLLDLSHARLEYPEVSFTRVGDIVTHAMGIRLQYESPLLSAVVGDWVEMTVRTMSGLGTAIEWAEITNLPIRACTVAVRHDGTRKTTLTNQSGPALIWRPMFEGRHETLLVNGTAEKALAETDAAGKAVSSVRVAVGAGGQISVEAPA